MLKFVSLFINFNNFKVKEQNIPVTSPPPIKMICGPVF